MNTQTLNNDQITVIQRSLDTHSQYIKSILSMKRLPKKTASYYKTELKTLKTIQQTLNQSDKKQEQITCQ